MDDEKILLVIGNGFDLAHGLKTKYTDFLDFMNDARKNHIAKIVTKSMEKREKMLEVAESNMIPQILEENKKLREQQENMYWQEIKENCKNFDLLKQSKVKLNEKLVQNSLNLSDVLEYFFKFGNVWVEHFNAINSTGENWVDLENEIADVVKKFENLILTWQDLSLEELKEKIIDILNFISEGFFSTDKSLVQKDIPNMSWDLKILTLAFEFYLMEEMKKLEIKPKPIIRNLRNVLSIISYNYTNVWNKIYDTDRNIEPYFIHGELGKHNLVLGIGETLPSELADRFTVCASFKKFFQRVKYRLGNKYQDIARNNNNEIINWHVVIYGHSLDSTDSDSLHWLLKNRELNDSEVFIRRITIYYYDEDSYNQQIANIIQIIGKKELIDSVNSGRIVFKRIDNSA